MVMQSQQYGKLPVEEGDRRRIIEVHAKDAEWWMTAVNEFTYLSVEPVATPPNPRRKCEVVRLSIGLSKAAEKDLHDHNAVAIVDSDLKVMAYWHRHRQKTAS